WLRRELLDPGIGRTGPDRSRRPGLRVVARQAEEAGCRRGTAAGRSRTELVGGKAGEALAGGPAQACGECLGPVGRRRTQFRTGAILRRGAVRVAGDSAVPRGVDDGEVSPLARIRAAGQA